MNQDMSIIQLVLHASFVVQLVMVILMAISIASWAAIVGKLTAIKRIQTLNEEFEQQFWSGISLNDLFSAAVQNSKLSGPMERIFASGMREYQKLRERRISDTGTLLDGARRAMRASFQREMDVAEAQLSFLASVGSVSPYVGLFGTVWGIMHAFTGLASMQQVTLATVAPGIAEALRATLTAWPSNWKHSSKSFPTSCKEAWVARQAQGVSTLPALVFRLQVTDLQGAHTCLLFPLAAVVVAPSMKLTWCPSSM
jgi:biopolymer transport protein TolQ